MLATARARPTFEGQYHRCMMSCLYCGLASSQDLLCFGPRLRSVAAHLTAACRQCSAGLCSRLADAVSILRVAGRQSGHPKNVYRSKSGATVCATGSPVMTQVTYPRPAFESREVTGLDPSALCSPLPTGWLLTRPTVLRSGWFSQTFIHVHSRWAYQMATC